MFLCPWLPKRRLMLSLWFYSIKKSVGVEPLLVPRTEALALPIFSKRATQRPTPICIKAYFHRVPVRALRTQKLGETNAYIHIPQASTVAFVFEKIWNCQISVRQEQSAVNALKMLRLSPPALTAGLCRPFGVGLHSRSGVPGFRPCTAYGCRLRTDGKFMIYFS